MGLLTPDQRHILYHQEATRSGIHKPILAALHQLHSKPFLSDGETGLGIAPIHQIALTQVDTFPTQVQYAANTIRSLTDRLTVEGWKGDDLWQAEQGRYTDKFVQAIAAGYTAPSSAPDAALLEASDQTALLTAYVDDFAADCQTANVPLSQTYLDDALLHLIAQLPQNYNGLPQQQAALLELVRLWRKLDTRAAAIDSLLSTAADAPLVANLSTATADDFSLDRALLQFVPLVIAHYAGYPHQREALLRLTQLWHQLDSRTAAIAALAEPPSLTLSLSTIDPALIAFIQRLPASYEGNGEQRNALVEGFRLWQQLDSRSAALIALGVNPDLFTAATPDQTAIVNAAIQLDQALLAFNDRLPTVYAGTDLQRAALLRQTQLWRTTATPEQTIQSLLRDLKQMHTARRDTPDAAPKPTPLSLPSPPDRWTPDNLQLYAAISANGSFIWAEATQGGTQLPTNQATVDAIIHIAQLAQQARDRVGRPFHVVHWYCPSDHNISVNHAIQYRHRLGDAISFYCEGLTGNQLYWFLDPWWTGGLGCDRRFPSLCTIAARSDRTRWLN